MNNNIQNDWLDAIKSKTQDATREVPEGTWDGIASALAQKATVNKPRKLAPRIWKVAAAAAVVAIVSTTGYFAFKHNSDNGQEQPVRIAQQPKVAPQVPSESPVEELPPVAEEPLLAQNTPSPAPMPVAPANRRPTRYYDDDSRYEQEDYPELLDNELLANCDGELIDLADYPNEFNPENYFYDIETMLALEELYAQYDNAMNQEAMEPWKSYVDSTYQQYLIYDANARRDAREKMALTKPGKKKELLLAAYGSGLVSGDRNSTASGSSAAAMLAPASTPPSGMMMAPAAPGVSPLVAPPINYNYHHHMPLTFGVTFTKRITGNIYGNIGLNFTSMTSDVTPDNGGSSFKQSVKLIGLPFGVRWNFWRYKGLTTFVGGEGLVERVVDASFGKEDVTIKRLQWSVHATAGLQYNFTRHVGIYVAPKLSHYITTMPLKTQRNEHPFNFNLQVGLSLDF